MISAVKAYCGAWRVCRWRVHHGYTADQVIEANLTVSIGNLVIAGVFLVLAIVKRLVAMVQ